MTKSKNKAAQALGKLGRARNTPAQQKAARENGRKGGRPLLGICIECGNKVPEREPVKNCHGSCKREV